jgi:REP-associated tyrosine transposase
MARPLRLEFAGAIYHVTARGNAQEPIYLDDGDRDRFLTTLARVVKRYEWICHAYCLMGNHYHLVVETPRPSLAAGMQHLNGVYAQGFNQRHGRVGHVFGGRFKAVLVERQGHLAKLAAYVVCNPVKAGVCAEPSEWAYSSYRATAGLTDAPAYLTIDWLLSQFAPDRRLAQARFRAFVTEHSHRPWDELRGGIYLGTDDFVDELAPNEPLREIVRPQWQPLLPSLPELFDEYGSSALEVAHRRYGYPLRAIADHLGLHYSTVGRRLASREGADVATQDLTPNGSD